MRPLSEESGEPNKNRDFRLSARAAQHRHGRARARATTSRVMRRFPPCVSSVPQYTLHPPSAGTIIETPPPMAQRGTSTPRTRRGPIPALLVAMGLVVPSRAAAFTTTLPPSPARHRRTQSSVLLGAEPTDRRGALIGGLLGGYTLFELSGGAKRLQDATGIGIGALKNSTMTE